MDVHPAQEHLAPLQRAMLLPLVFAGLAMGVMVCAMLLRTGGQFSTPIDDAFIHAQYARHLAQGHLYQWSPGDEYSLGATSPLYPWILAGGWAVGFRDHWILLYALLFNTGGLLVGVWVAGWLISNGVQDDRHPGVLSAWPAAIASLPVALNPNLLHGAANGMETGLSFGLFGLFLAALYRDWKMPAPGRPRTSTLLLGALTGLARPDLLALEAPMFLLTVVRHGTRWSWRGPAFGMLIPLPLLGVFGLNYAASGLALPNSAALKSIRNCGWLSSGEKFDKFFSQLHGVPMDYLMDSYTRPALGSAVLLILVGVGFLLVRPSHMRRSGERLWDLASVVTAAGFCVIPAGLQSADEGAFRFYHAAWMLGFIGLARLSLTGWNARPCAKRLRTGLPVAAFVLLTLGALWRFPAMTDQYRDHSRYLLDNHVELGRTIRERARDDARFRGPILTHEAGALPYFSGVKFLDLVGLCSNPERGSRMTDYYVVNASLCFEAIERLPEHRWPRLSAVFMEGMGSFTRLPFTVGPPLLKAREPGEPGVVARYWLGVYRFPRHLLRSGHAPAANRIPEGWRVVDRLDVADIVNEREHRFSMAWPKTDIIKFAGFDAVRRGDHLIGDCGWRVNVPARFVLKGLEEGRPVRLVGRFFSPCPTRFVLAVEGVAEQKGSLPTMGGMIDIEIARLDQAPGPDVHVHLDPVNHWFNFYHLWAIQPGRGPGPSEVGSGSTDRFVSIQRTEP